MNSPLLRPEGLHTFRACLAGLYGAPSFLYFGTFEPILSESGSQQGCPTGGVALALTLHAFLMAHPEIMAELSVSIWIADDGLLGGTNDAIGKFLNAMVVDGPKFGLFLNLGKCCIYTQDGSLPPELQPLGVAVKPLADLTLLGVAVGSPESRQKFAAGIATRIEGLNNLLCTVAVTAPHAALCLLVQCGSFARANYFLRAFDPDPAWARVDRSTQSVLAAIIPGISGLAIQQAALPTILGGLGARQCERLAGVAFIAAAGQAQPLLKHFSTFQLTVDDARMRALIAINLPNAPDAIPTQKAMSLAIHKEALRKL